ncbi:hypothetical protein MGA3_15296 [Bacillus methanolicus MGA3]|nr:hypothetical protein MGA3_15296 [Bacillus methanolicus MGA3]
MSRHDEKRKDREIFRVFPFYLHKKSGVFSEASYIGLKTYLSE